LVVLLLPLRGHWRLMERPPLTGINDATSRALFDKDHSLPRLIGIR
jgi:hypothetical protein